MARRSTKTVRKGRGPAYLARPALAASLVEFVRFADRVNDAVILVSEQRKVVYLNPAAEHLLDYGSREVAGKEIHRLLMVGRQHHRYKPSLWSQMRGIRRPNPPVPVAAVIRRKDGVDLPVEVSVSRCVIGGKHYSMGIMRDVTKRDQIEKLLKETEQRFFAMAERSPNMIFVNLDGRVVYANVRCEEMMGYKRAEFYSPGFDFRRLTAPGYEKLVEKKFRMHMQGREVEPYEYALATKDGRHIEAIMTTRLISYGGKRAILGLITDITERKQAERAIRESKMLWEKIFASMTEVVGVVDLKTRTTITCNQAVERVLGYKAEEVIGHNTRFLYASLKEYEDFGKKYPELGRAESAARLQRKTINVRFRMRCKDGRIIPTEHTISVIADADRVIGVNVMRDLTLRQRIEDQTRRYQEQLRTLASELSQTEERERRRIAKSLHDYVGQNLALSRIKMGGLREKLADPSDRRAIDEVRKLVEESIRSIRTLTFELSPPLLYEVGLGAAVEWLAEQTREQSAIDVKVRIKGRSGRLDDDLRIFLYNAVRELLLNVVKHSRARRCRVDLLHARGRITISVRDNGVGIPTDRTEPARRRAAAFGLFSIRERINNYGGGIKISGRPGTGTAVTLWAPIKPGRAR